MEYGNTKGSRKKKKAHTLYQKDKFILRYSVPEIITSITNVHFCKSFLRYPLSHLARRCLQKVFIQNRLVARPGLKTYSFFSPFSCTQAKNYFDQSFTTPHLNSLHQRTPQPRVFIFYSGTPSLPSFLSGFTIRRTPCKQQ